MEIKKNGRYVKVCPRCRSENITEFANLKTRPGYINFFWRCLDCRFDFDGEWIDNRKDEDRYEDSPTKASDRSKSSV